MKMAAIGTLLVDGWAVIFGTVRREMHWASVIANDVTITGLPYASDSYLI